MTPEKIRKNWVNINPARNVIENIEKDILAECDIWAKDYGICDYIVNIDIYDITSTAYQENTINYFEEFVKLHKKWKSVDDMYTSYLQFCNRLRVTYINHDKLIMVAEGSNTYTPLYDAIYTRDFKYKIGDHIRIRDIDDDNIRISENVYEVVDIAPRFEDFRLMLSGTFGYTLKCISENPSENESLEYDYEDILSEDQFILVK